MQNILMVIGYDRFRDEEYFIPKEHFEQSGFKVTTACAQKTAMSRPGDQTVTADILIDEINTDAYDAIVFVGGGGASVYFNDKTVHKIAWDFYGTGKIIGAICIAPVILANAGLLVGKKATVFPDGKTELCNGNCLYTEEPVVTDGRIITANGPAAAQTFAEAVVERLNLRT